MEWREAIKKKASIVQRVKATDDGKRLFEMLTETFEAVELFDSDPLKMAANVARRDVVQYLKELGDLNHE